MKIKQIIHTSRFILKVVPSTHYLVTEKQKIPVIHWNLLKKDDDLTVLFDKCLQKSISYPLHIIIEKTGNSILLDIVLLNYKRTRVETLRISLLLEFRHIWELDSSKTAGPIYLSCPRNIVHDKVTFGHLLREQYRHIHSITHKWQIE
jgi:hypothetical protein